MLYFRDLIISLAFSAGIVFQALNFTVKNYPSLEINLNFTLLFIFAVFLISLFSSSALLLILKKHSENKKSRLFENIYHIALFLFFSVSCYTVLESILATSLDKVLRGQMFNILDFIPQISAEIIFLILFIALFFIIKKRNCFEILYKVSLAIIIFQIISLLSSENIKTINNIFSKDDPITYKNYAIDYNSYGAMSDKNNIIVIVLDAFSSNVFQKLISENKEFKTIFKDFEYYPYFYSSKGNDYTKAVLPVLIGGGIKNDYDLKDEYWQYVKSQYEQDTNMFFNAKNQGYKVDIYPSFKSVFYFDTKYEDNIIPVWKSEEKFDKYYKKYLDGIFSLYLLPTAFKKGAAKSLYAISQGNQICIQGGKYVTSLDFINYFKNNKFALSPDKYFKFYHLTGLHSPRSLDENIKESDSSDIRSCAIANLKIMDFYLKLLKENNIYDNSAIIILGDHGLDITKKELSQNYAKNDNVKNPLLLYKNFNQKQNEMKTIENTVPEITDISNLIQYTLKLKDKKFNITPKQTQERLEDMKKFVEYIVE